jgi:hypothetical protein
MDYPNENNHWEIEYMVQLSLNGSQKNDLPVKLVCPRSPDNSEIWKTAEAIAAKRSNKDNVYTVLRISKRVIVNAGDLERPQGSDAIQ